MCKNCKKIRAHVKRVLGKLKKKGKQHASRSKG